MTGGTALMFEERCWSPVVCGVRARVRGPRTENRYIGRWLSKAAAALGFSVITVVSGPTPLQAACTDSAAVSGAAAERVEACQPWGIDSC